MKSSAVRETNVASWYVFGVSMGSMERRDRRRRGVECEIAGVTRECRMVGRRIEAGQK